MPGVLSQPWAVLHICSNHEKIVVAHLEGRGVEYYLPTYKVNRTRSDHRKVTLELPLFPGYIFAKFARRQQLSVITVPGIVRILEVPGGLATVADAEILRLQEGLLANLKLLPAVPYAVGDRVRILRGPFQGCEAYVTRSRNQFIRVVLSIGDIKSCSFSVDAVPPDIELISTVMPIS